jgi:SRSO17 transposase
MVPAFVPSRPDVTCYTHLNTVYTHSIRNEKRMKYSHHSTDPQEGPTPEQIAGWSLTLRQWQSRLAPLFARPEVLEHALLYLQAILSDLPRKNGWQIAEHARQLRPYGMQRLLSRAVWDQDAVRDELRHFVCQSLLPAGEEDTSAFPLLILDESGFPKRGTHSAGVGPQYCGISGRVENCQVGVFLSYATTAGHALIDRELYLPEDWCADAARRQSVHIPASVRFATKPELGQHMIQRVQEAGLPYRWVVADSVYGHSPELRGFLQRSGCPYALGVPCIEVVCVQTHEGLLLREVGSISHYLRSQDWQRLSMSQGSKGERLFDWARLPWVQGGSVDGEHWLLLRRCLDDPAELAYYLVWAPLQTPLATMVQAVGARWRIEEDLEASKDLGLDQYEVRSYLGWYRHSTLVLLAYAFLVSICVQDHVQQGSPEQSPDSSPLSALTPSEVQHLLARLVWPLPASVPLVCAWSRFRRSHQYWAGYYHRRRRTKAASP